MKRELFKNIENYMLRCMNDSAHDKEHIYRVLYTALDIAGLEEHVDMDVLITACLLHDIGREEQFQDPELCHAEVGSEKAYHYLIANHWAQDKAEHVRECILAHRYRNDNLPRSIEAKILFDSDKLDAAGTLGIARTILYQAQVGGALYSCDQEGNVSDGTKEEDGTFFHEYKFKLEHIYDRFYTVRGSQLAKERQHSAAEFYHSMLVEVRACYSTGVTMLSDIIE